MGVFVGLVCALTWALGAISLRDLAKKLDPFTLNAPRTLVAGVVMLLVTVATGRSAGYANVTADRLALLLASVMVGGGIGDSCYVVSLARIGVSRAFPIASTYPALTLVFAVLFLHESISVGTVVGLILVLGGILLVGRAPANANGAVTQTPRQWGVELAMLASLCWAISNVLVAPGIRGLDPIMVASIRTPALSLALFAIAAARGTLHKLLRLSTKEWGVLIVGGLIGWGLGSALYLQTVAMVGAGRAAILTATSPLMVLPLSVLFLRERFTLPVLAGTALTVVGIILVA